MKSQAIKQSRNMQSRAGAMKSRRSNGAQARRDGCAAPEDEARLSSVARALIVEHPDPATLLEIYYWSQEPGLGQTIRAYMSLPKPTRSVLRAFWQMAGNPHLISATIDERGRLELASPEIVDTLTLLRGEGRRTSRL